MTTQSMNKVIHNAVRRDLRRFIAALEAYGASDPRRAAALGRAWENFDDQLTHHHEGEHEIAWPTLTELGVDPKTIARLDAEHDKMAAALERVRGAMTVFNGSARPGDAAKALRAFRILEKATLQHLDSEESAIEPVYLEHEGSPALKAMSRKFQKSQSLPRAGRFLAWLTDSDDPAEVRAITGQVPAPVVKVVGGLFGRGYRRAVAPVWRA